VKLGQEDLLEELEAFGLSLNQAKIYLSILQTGSISVGKIAESTKLHRQDIYKTMPKLEKMGLIARRLGKPVYIEAIPMEKALNALVATERKNANARITRLKGLMKRLVKATGKHLAKPEPFEEDGWFTLLSTDAEIKNMANYTFENARKECNMVLSLEMIKQRMYYFHDYFQTLAKNKVRTRLIIETPNSLSLVEKTIEEVGPHKDNFTVKVVNKETPIPYFVIDQNEVWISRKKLTESGIPCVLWTNSKNITQFRQENFEKAWNNSEAITIFPKENSQGETKVVERNRAIANLA
jgi:sugar-specific transcriptional regulator TrmB